MFISDIRTLNPTYYRPQVDCLSWLAQAYVRYQKEQTYSLVDYQKLLKKVACSPEQIAGRYFYLPDFDQSPNFDQDADELNRSVIFGGKDVAGTSVRQKFFHETSTKIFAELFGTQKISEHLIHVSCTGYGSPSGAQLIAAQKSPDTIVTHSYHMGCYGVFPALRMASGFLSASQLHLKSDSAADIVHTELCTLHVSPEDPSLEQMVIQSLFADGVAAYTVSGKQRQNRSLQILALAEFLLPQTELAMQWSIGNHGMAMTLSKDVPKLIGESLRDALVKWERQIGKSILKNLSQTLFAIHPGGPKILDAVKGLLELSESQILFSREVLRERGNMSSATVPHIWQKMLASDDVVSGTQVISMAFGPGLTLCLSLMQVA